MTKLTDGIDDLLNKCQISENEKIIIRRVLLSLSAFENALFNANKNIGNICIARKIHKILCDGDETSNAISSHIVPRNQLDKLQTDYSEFFGFSFKMADLFNGKHLEANLKSGRFVGFCPKCENTFKENIDSNLNQSIHESALSTFRYLGKMIHITECELEFFKNIVSEKDLSINKNELEFYFKFKGNDLHSYILDLEKNLYQYILSFYDLKNFWNSRDYKNIYGKENLYYLRKTTTKEFIISGQSLGFVPLFFKDTEAKLLIFTQFQYDEKTKSTVCSLFSYKHHFDKFEKILKSFKVNNNELAQIFLILSMKYNRNIFFIEKTEAILNKIEKIIINLVNERQKGISRDIYSELERIIILLRSKVL